jgi:NAD(P)-dependent dehydrogenase (short-subunit alcohol dehydrogenase family)
MSKIGKLSESTAIVTAASQGIGETIAKTLAREGAVVAVVDVNLPEAERVGAEIEAVVSIYSNDSPR